jgi:low affinity Fe/Cu permease
LDARETFRKFSTRAANALGSPWLFVVSVFLIGIWLLSGPFTHFSDTWQLLVNTATTVFTFLAVFLIQNTQNRDAKAMHLKLDELIHAIKGARNQLVDLEDLSDAEIEKLEAQFRQLHQRAMSGETEEQEGSDVEDEIDKRREPRSKKNSEAKSHVRVVAGEITRQKNEQGLKGARNVRRKSNY